MRTTLAALGFAPATADPSLFLRIDTSLPPFYVLVYVVDLVFATADTEALTLVKSELQKRHTCTDPEPSGPYPELVGRLMYLMTCTRLDFAYPLSLMARYVALGRHRKVHWDIATRVLRYLCCTSGLGLVLEGRGPVVLTGHADASWVDDSPMQRSPQSYTFSLEQPRSPPVLYVDNKAMIALSEEHRMEHRTKHITLRYFLARELQQRGQLRPAYVATRANTDDIFTKALLPSDHQRFSTVLGLGGERYFLLVVDKFTRHTTVFPLQSKADLRSVLIHWIRAVRLQLRARFQQDLPVLRLHSDRGGEFSSFLHENFCGAEGIVQSFTLLASPQQNGIAERRIGLVMGVACTFLIHAAAPHFLWPFAVRYAAHQLNLWPHVSHPETSPTLRWMGEVGDVFEFWVWGSLSLVRELPAGKLSLRTLRCVFLSFPTDAPPWKYYHAGSRRVLSSHDVNFDESVCFYHLHPHRTPLPPPGPAPSGVSQVDPPPLVEPLEVSSDTSGPAEGGDPTAADTVTPRLSTRLAVPPGFLPQPSSPPLQPVVVFYGAAGGGDTGGADSGGVGSGGAECPTGIGGAGGTAAGGAAWGSPGGGTGHTGAGGTGPGGASVGVPGFGRAEGTGAGGTSATRVTGGTGAVGAVAGGTGSRRQEPLSPERLREWAVRWDNPGGGAGRTGAGGTGPGGASASVLGVGGTGGDDTGGANTGGTNGGTRVGGASRQESLSPQQLREWAVRWRSPGGGAGGTGSGGAVPTGARGSGGVTTQPQPSALCHLLSLLPAATEFPVAGTTPPLLFPPTDQSPPQLLPDSPMPDPHVVLPSPPASSLPHVPDLESDLVRTASPTVTRLLATVVTDPSFESATASALVAKLVDFAALCRLDYAASLILYSSSPPSVGGELALGCDVVEDRQFKLECLAAAAPHLRSTLLCPEGDPDALDIPTPRSYANAIMCPYSSQWQIAMDTEMASWKSTGTYIDAVSPPGANIVDGMWIFIVKRPPGFPPAFKARHVARGFSLREGGRLLPDLLPHPEDDHSLGATARCSTARLRAALPRLLNSLPQAIWLHRPPGFTGSFPEGTQWISRRPVYGLRQAAREWYDTLRTTLAALGFAPSTADPSLFLRTDTSLPPFYIFVYVDDLVFAIADTEALALVKAELQERHTCTDLGELRSYLGLEITRATARRTITLTQSHMVQQILQRFGFSWSSPQPTPLPTGHSVSAPPLDKSVEPSGPYTELVCCLMCLMTCTRPDLAYPLSLLARYVDPVVLTSHSDASWADDQMTHRSTQGYSFSLRTGSVSWRSTRSSSVLSSSCESDIYAGAMAAHELRWLTYQLTDLGERPRSPPVLYVDDKAMIALGQIQRLEHRTKHIALRYFLTWVCSFSWRAAPPESKPRRPAEPCRPTEPRHPAEPRRPTEPHCPAYAAPAATAISAATAATAAMASPTVLTFDAEGRAVDFDVWVDDLQLFLQCDSKNGVSLFDHTSGVSPAPGASADSTVRSQWTARDNVARLAVRSHLPSAERAHFGQYKTAKSLYEAVAARYSSPATAALSRLMLAYLFPDLAAFATVADLITHLRTSDARYCAARPTDHMPP
ncbi:unnamed protein product [Closterium sp. NIES-53]